MRYLLVFLLFILTSASAAQEAMDISVSVVTYQKAKSAELIQEPSEVLIVSEGLQPGMEYAAKLRVANQDNQYIEVFPEKTPFPPKVIEPFKPGEYLIPGKQGETFNVSIRSKDGKPVWLVVTIGGGGATEPETPSGDYLELARASYEQASKAGDTKTALALAAAFNRVATTTPVDKPLADAVFEARKARELVLLERQGNANWNAWLMAVDTEIGKLKISKTSDYLKALVSVAEGLNKAAGGGK